MTPCPFLHGAWRTFLLLKYEVGNSDFTQFYYISKLVRALWLVNLVGRTLLYGPRKFKIVSVAKLLRDLSAKLHNLF